MKRIFILVPSIEPKGPIKGAMALANILCEYSNITFISLKGDIIKPRILSKKVNYLSLKCKSPISKIITYRNLLSRTNSENVISLSYCLSADLTNFFCFGKFKKIASIRGNLFKNYRFEYGYFGYILAFFHLILLNKFDEIIVMSLSMKKQVRKFTLSKITIIENFIDESKKNITYPKKVYENEIKFIFIGDLTLRKRPDLIINAIYSLKKKGTNCYLDIIGKGPLLDELSNMVHELNLSECIKFHGFVKDPIINLIKSDVFVLPSLSEGISRASMEALYNGIPCLLRDVDANHELISLGINGYLFEDDNDLPSKMLLTYKLSKRIRSKKNLLPSNYRKNKVIIKYRNLLDI